MLPWPRFAGDRTQPQSAGASAGPLVCAGRCILRAECPERFLSLLAALTFMEDVACSLYLIWFFTPFRFIVVLKLPSLSQTAVVYFLVRLLHGRVSS